MYAGTPYSLGSRLGPLLSTPNTMAFTLSHNTTYSHDLLPSPIGATWDD